MFKISTWDVKEPTHYSKSVGREVPGVLLSSKCGRLGVMFLKRLVVYEATYAKKQPQVKKEPCRVLDNVGVCLPKFCVNILPPFSPGT